jgi:hypothetical protein
MDDPDTKELQFFKNHGVKLKITSLKQMIENQKHLETRISKKKELNEKKFDENDEKLLLSETKQKIHFTKE